MGPWWWDVLHKSVKQLNKQWVKTLLKTLQQEVSHTSRSGLMWPQAGYLIGRPKVVSLNRCVGSVRFSFHPLLFVLKTAAEVSREIEVAGRSGTTTLQQHYTRLRSCSCNHNTRCISVNLFNSIYASWKHLSLRVVLKVQAFSFNLRVSTNPNQMNGVGITTHFICALHILMDQK